MKIGFFTNWDIDSLKTKGNVVGDELWARTLIKSMKKLNTSIEAYVYAPNYMPEKKLDVMIYLNESDILDNISKKHVIYFQNISNDHPFKVIDNFKNKAEKFDGYIFFSQRMKDYFGSVISGKKSLYLPFAADTDFFYPKEFDPRYAFECSYVGNDIKGEEATMRYIYPATEFSFGLFGNWKLPKYRLKFWKNFKKQPLYKKVFEKISKGKIPQEDLPILYSSSKIILNCTAPNAIQWDIITLRTYEVLACKGFLITDKTPLAEEELSECVVFTDGYEDLKEKIRYYLDNDKERIKIAEKGYNYVQKNARIEFRSQDLLKYLKEIL